MKSIYYIYMLVMAGIVIGAWALLTAPSVYVCGNNGLVIKTHLLGDEIDATLNGKNYHGERRGVLYFWQGDNNTIATPANLPKTIERNGLFQGLAVDGNICQR